MDRILQTLRFRPRGLTITEISKQTHITRNSVSKHLEVLRIRGQVDMHGVGNAKVYSLAQRVPMSAFLCFTRNLIVVLDSCGTIVQINDQFLKLAGLIKEGIVGENIRDVPIPMVSTEEVIAKIEGVKREQLITDVSYRHNNKDHFYQMQVIPTVFDDGKRGRTIVFEEITEKKRYVRNMEFLAKTAMEFVVLPEETDLYQRIAELLNEFIPDGQVFVQSYDELRNHFVIRSVLNRDFRDALTSLIGRDPVGMVFPLDNVSLSPSLENPGEIRRDIREIQLKVKHGTDSFSFYDIVFQQIPEDICDEIMITRDIGKAYLAFFAWKEQLLGDVGIFMSADDKLEDIQALESFIRMASIAISKRMTEERLHRSNGRFREVVELSPFPAAIINSDGHYTFINHRFTEVFGYTLADIPTGREWFKKAFPDEELHKTVIATWKSDIETGVTHHISQRTFQVHCKNGDLKIILFRAITLCDHTQFITYEDVTELRRVLQILLSDIAGLKNVEEELRIKDQALASMTCPVSIADVTGLMKYANPAFLSMWRYESLKEVVGMHISEFWTISNPAEDGTTVHDTYEQWSGVLTGFRKDKSTFTTQATVNTITDNKGQMLGLMGYFADITPPI